MYDWIYNSFIEAVISWPQKSLPNSGKASLAQARVAQYGSNKMVLDHCSISKCHVNPSLLISGVCTLIVAILDTMRIC